MESRRNGWSLLAKSGRSLAVPALAVVLALAIGFAVIMALGLSPVKAYSLLFRGAFGSKYGAAETIVKATPLIFTGLSYAFAFRCGLFNIGAEGQLHLGALGAVLAGLYVHGLPPILHLSVALITGFLAGGVLGYIPGWLKARLGVSEVINTIMLNYVAKYLVSWAVCGPLKEPGSLFPQSAMIDTSARLPLLAPPTRLHSGFLLGFLMLFVFYILIWRTVFGLEVRAVGSGPKAAEALGVNWRHRTVLCMLVAGGFGGLAGASEVLGIQHRLFEALSPGYGWDGIAVGLLGRATPVGILAAALLFGALRSGGNMMQRAMGVPVAIVYLLQAVIILVVVGSMMLDFRRRRKGPLLAVLRDLLART